MSKLMVWRVVSLNLSNNKITSIPDVVLALTNLQNLDLSNNYLIDVPVNSIENLNLDHNLLEGYLNQDSIKIKDKYTYVNLIQFADYSIAREYITKTGESEDIVFPLNLNIIPDDYVFFKDGFPDSLGDTTGTVEIVGASVSNNNTRLNNVKIKITAGSTINQMEALINENNWLSQEVARQRGKTVNNLTKNDYELITSINKNSSGLTYVPITIGLCTNLDNLSVMDNQLTTFQKELTNLQLVKTLYIHINKITSIPKEIKNMSNLSTFIAHTNVIEQFTPELYYLTNLKILSISGTFSSIPAGISGLANLNCLEIQRSNITTLPEEIYQLKQLQILTITESKLTNIPYGISNLNNLKTLYLQDNKLTTLPDDISSLVNLIELKMNYNLFLEIPDNVTQLPNLKVLYAGQSTLTAVSDNIRNLQSLSALSLSGSNCIKAFSSEISKLTNLTTLNIDSCKLTSIPNSVFDMPFLKS